MIIKRAFPGNRAFQETKALYYSAFSEEERLSFRRMTLLSVLRPSVDLLAYYEDDRFCGFSFTVATGRYLYINFFAVSPTLRGKGYGSRMAALLREKFPGAALCEVKAPIETKATYQQDIQRIRFWERNGFDFFDGAYPITNPHGVRYFVGTTHTTFDRQAYRTVFDHLSFGLGSQLRLLKGLFQK